ncbi:MAG: putative Co/Zn/Cd efflux system rane fusion protein [Myxococcales bacterium]|nr:putative Co/Zn/Cd efflux system rane fusion protein [Myxococcales bacterium]
MRFRSSLIAPSLSLLLALPVVASGCNKSSAEAALAAGKPEAAAPLSVKSTEVRELKVPRTLTLSGSLIGSEEAKVAAGAAGKVLSTSVERGAVVRKGALLVKLDARTLGAQADEAAAQVSSIKAQAAQAQLDCARTDQLFEKGAISKADHDKARTQCETTKWSVSAAEARKNLTSEQLRDTEIRAPFSGMIVERFVSAGEYVRPDSPVVELVDVDNLRVELTVPEADVTQVRQGMMIDFHTAANDDGPAYRGKVRYVGPSVRKQTRDSVVEAAVENQGHDLRPGMFVQAKLSLGVQSLPAVPAAAVRSEGTLRHVFVIVGDHLEDRLVQVADTTKGMVPILVGLKAGEKIAAQATAEMRDGAKVQ